MRTVRSAARLWLVVLAAAAPTLVGCGGDSSGSSPSYESSIVNEEVPKMDIKNLPDIEVASAQMVDLIEQVHAEVARLVPASAPWTRRHKDTREGCDQEGFGGSPNTLRNSPRPTRSPTRSGYSCCLQSSVWLLRRA